MIGKLVFSDKGMPYVEYADDVYIDVNPSSIKAHRITGTTLVEYELWWLDAKSYANITKIIENEPLPILSVYGYTG